MEPRVWPQTRGQTANSQPQPSGECQQRERMTKTTSPRLRLVISHFAPTTTTSSSPLEWAESLPKATTTINGPRRAAKQVASSQRPVWGCVFAPKGPFPPHTVWPVCRRAAGGVPAGDYLAPNRLGKASGGEGELANERASELSAHCLGAGMKIKVKSWRPRGESGEPKWRANDSHLSCQLRPCGAT